jgi:indole-3-acetate monooxygenase
MARAEALMRAARAHLIEATNRQWDDIADGTPRALQTRASIRLATSFCAEACSSAVDLVHAAAEGSAIQETLPIARCFRDIHAATQHIGLNAGGFELSRDSQLGQRNDHAFAIEVLGCCVAGRFLSLANPPESA